MDRVEEEVRAGDTHYLDIPLHREEARVYRHHHNQMSNKSLWRAALVCNSHLDNHRINMAVLVRCHRVVAVLVVVDLVRDLGN